jgi:hypothetical protein
MLDKIGIREQATAKTLDIEPTSVGVRFFVKNGATEERAHIELTAGDIKRVIELLQIHLNELVEMGVDLNA